jgi:ribonuclease T2
MLFRRKPSFLPVVAAILVLNVAPPALAQRGPYGSPAPPRASGHVAGQFDYYALVLSWSPTFCAGPQRRNFEPQCDARDGRRHAFVLHGLWPQFERGSPEFCETRDRPFVPQPVIERMLDIMPSPRLVIHEYRKHGTCTGLDPAGYYEVSRKLFAKVSIPPRYVNLAGPMFIGPAELAQEFVAANPGLEPDMIAIECRGTGNRLRAVRICFSREGSYRACGANERQRRLCPAERMYVPPVRPGAGVQPDPNGPSGQRLSPRPGPPGRDAGERFD